MNESNRQRFRLISKIKIMRLKLAFIVLLIFTRITGFANDSQLPPDYAHGLKLLNEGKVEEAKFKLSEFVEQNPRNAQALFNLGLAEFKLQNIGIAIGLWRRAMHFSPSLDSARQAIDFASDQLKVKALPHQVSYWEEVRKFILIHFSFLALSTVSLLILTTGFWFLIGYFARRRKMMESDGVVSTSLPIAPSILTFIGLIMGSLSVMKIIDRNIARATIIEEKVFARASPGENQAELFELYEGLEVVVRNAQGDTPREGWVQVTYPGGSTGWIPRSSVLFQSGSTIW